MAYELINTSAPKGLKPGSSGFCTVSYTAGISANYVTLLESLSGYKAAFPAYDENAHLNPVAFSFTSFNLGGQQLYIMSRICFAGFDYTKRSNKLAHHLVLKEDELVAGGPAALFLNEDKPLFRKAWDDEPCLINSEVAIPDIAPVHGVAKAWEKATGEPGWAGFLAQNFMNDPQSPSYIIFKPGMEILPLINEALLLLPTSRRWDVTFNTYVHSIPRGVQCAWRCCLADSPILKESRRSQSMVLDLTQPEALNLDEYCKTYRVDIDSSLIVGARTGTLPGPEIKPEPRRQQVKETQIEQRPVVIRQPEALAEQTLQPRHTEKPMLKNKKLTLPSSKAKWLEMEDVKKRNKWIPFLLWGGMTATIVALLFFMFQYMHVKEDPKDPDSLFGDDLHEDVEVKQDPPPGNEKSPDTGNIDKNTGISIPSEAPEEQISPPAEEPPKKSIAETEMPAPPTSPEDKINDTQPPTIDLSNAAEDKADSEGDAAKQEDEAEQPGVKQPTPKEKEDFWETFAEKIKSKESSFRIPTPGVKKGDEIDLKFGPENEMDLWKNSKHGITEKDKGPVEKSENTTIINAKKGDTHIIDAANKIESVPYITFSVPENDVLEIIIDENVAGSSYSTPLELKNIKEIIIGGKIFPERYREDEDGVLELKLQVERKPNKSEITGLLVKCILTSSDEKINKHILKSRIHQSDIDGLQPLLGRRPLMYFMNTTAQKEIEKFEKKLTKYHMRNANKIELYKTRDNLQTLNSKEDKTKKDINDQTMAINRIADLESLLKDIENLTDTQLHEKEKKLEKDMCDYLENYFNESELCLEIYKEGIGEAVKPVKAVRRVRMKPPDTN